MAQSLSPESLFSSLPRISISAARNPFSGPRRRTWRLPVDGAAGPSGDRSEERNEGSRPQPGSPNPQERRPLRSEAAPAAKGVPSNHPTVPQQAQRTPADLQYWLASGLYTGFPAPVAYAEGRSPTGPSTAWPRRPPPPPKPAPQRDVPRRRVGGPSLSSIGYERSGPVQTVYRVSPFFAELRRGRRRPTAARILILDEGCEGRAALCEALLKAMLKKMRRPMDVEVESASIGEATLGPHRATVVASAAKAGVMLNPVCLSFPLPVQLSSFLFLFRFFYCSFGGGLQYSLTNSRDAAFRLYFNTL
jgi:hypothetical protein